MIHPGIQLEHDYTVLHVEGDKQAIAIAYNWCLDTFGLPGNRWFYKIGKFYFRDNKDYFLFELRW